jgi:uncharacterized protein involved in exopolysaccharide biosynthesis
VSKLTSENEKIIGILNNRIKFEHKGKLISLSVKMPDPELSAEVTKTVINLLIKYMTQFKIGKQLEELEFLESGTLKAEGNYKEAQKKYTDFKDRNLGLVLASFQAREQQLQNEFTLAFSLYNQYSIQLEQAKIQLIKDAPLFTVVEPVYVPRTFSNDSKKEAFSYISLGIFTSLLLIISFAIKIIVNHRKSII